MHRLTSLTVAAFALISSHNILAADWQDTPWQPIGQTAAYNVYINTQSVRRQDSYMKAWIQFDYNSEQSSDPKITPPYKFKSSEILVYVNCNTAQSAMVDLVYFSKIGGSGEVVSRTSLPSNIAPDFTDAIPGSAQDGVIKRICQRH